MRNEIGDRCFADSLTVYGKGKVVLFAEVDGTSFDSSEYRTKKAWLNAIVKRVHDCAMGQLNFDGEEGKRRNRENKVLIKKLVSR